jgi:CO/xanthine dehydrogenase Mo-binding subunit
VAGYRHIGKSTPRKDAADIVMGTAKYLNDMTLPGMLIGKEMRSPHPHAIIRSIDTTRAKALPGVGAVLTYQDIPKWKAGTPRHKLILDQKVRFVGDTVALIAAETEEITLEAIDLIDIEYELLPPVYTLEEAIRPDAPQLYEEFPGNRIPSGGYSFYGPNCLADVVRGDIEQGFKEADFVTEGTYGFENLPNPMALEAPGALAVWESPADLTIWSPGQSAYIAHLVLSMIMGRNVRVRSMGIQTGGSFGAKTVTWLPMMRCALLAKAANAPVKLSYSKEEQLATCAMRLSSRINASVGMKKDGTITAISGEWLIDTGAFSDMTQAQVAVGCGEVQLLLRCPNWNLIPKVVCTTRNPSGTVRGFGGQELKCALIPILTIAMEKANVDPFEFLKKNYVKPGDGYYWSHGDWWTCRGVDYTQAMEKGAEVFGWKDKWKGWLKPTSVNGPKRTGVGVAAHGNADVGEDVSEAYVRIDSDGTATIYSCVSEHGTGQKTNLCKMVAEVLNLSLDQVNMMPADSSVSPYEFGFVGSRGTYTTGSAVIKAAEDVRQKLFELAAEKLKAKPEELETEDGMIYVKGRPDVKIPWRVGMGFDRTCLGYGRFEPDFSVPNFMMTFVEIEVDIETGRAELLRVVNATNAGQIIDPLCIQNQINGCLGAAGIDSAIFERTIIDQRTGHVLNANLIDYLWRTFPDLPDMQNVILETPFPSHRFGAVGVGEIATAPGPAAVLMAASNAIGTRIYSYPVTPENILKALRKTN